MTVRARLCLLVGLGLVSLGCGREIIEVDGPDDPDDIDACAGPQTFGDDCTPAGGPCQTRADCCTGRCEPTDLGLVCLGVCAPNGTPCTGATDCCTYACIDGACAVGACVSVGQTCARDSDCCEGECSHDTHQCTAPDQVTCRGTGEACDDEYDCCSHACSDGGCQLGVGPCRADDSACAAGSDCCSGVCHSGACIGACIDDDGT